MSPGQDKQSETGVEDSYANDAGRGRGPSTRPAGPSTRRAIGTLFLIAGVGLLAYIPFTWVAGQLHQRSLRAQFDSQPPCPFLPSTATTASDAPRQADTGNPPAQADPQTLKQLAAAYRTQMTNHEAIARLDIPRMGKSLIVVEGDDEVALRMGTFHMPSTQIPGELGNFVVGGDRVLAGAPFLYLNELQIGDQINVTMQCASFTYEVYDTRIVEPEDLSLIQPQVDASSKPIETIALFTCDPPWDTSRRLIVLGRLTEATFRS